jgi:hypothetical protein
MMKKMDKNKTTMNFKTKNVKEMKLNNWISGIIKQWLISRTIKL